MRARSVILGARARLRCVRRDLFFPHFERHRKPNHEKPSQGGLGRLPHEAGCLGSDPSTFPSAPRHPLTGQERPGSLVAGDALLR